MTTFNYTSGAFSNLVGGTPGANVSNLVQLLNDLRTFLNGANLTDTNVTAAGLTDASLASPTNSVWRTVLTSQGTAAAAAITGAGVYYYNTTGANLSGTGATTVQGMWSPPVAGDIAVAGKTTRLRLRVVFAINATAPGLTVTWGLYPVTVAGPSNSIVPTLGTVITGSTAPLSATVPNAANVVSSASFDASLVTAGTAYVIGMSAPGAFAAASLMSCQFFLEMRHT